MSDYSSYLNKPILSGKNIAANYIEQPIIDYKGNPFIEALPPILSPIEAAVALRHTPYFDAEERSLPAHIRLHCVERIKDLIEPLSDHIDLEQRFSRMIRHGYTSSTRNPMATEYIKLLNTGAEAIRTNDLDYFFNYTLGRTTASGFVILGMSGIGKTTCVEKILLTYPQIIKHRSYKNKKLFINQIVWLKLDCPFDGSIKGLCLKFFHSIDQLLDTRYLNKHGKGSVESMLPKMSQLALIHGLGVLVIDEIQNLNQAKSGGSQKMLNFFVELVNTIGIPIVLIGTKEGLAPITQAFCNARRSTGEGDKNWLPMLNDEEWAKLIKAIWPYQWTEKECPITQEISNVLYEESCGITDIAVKLFILAQWRAITIGKEKIGISLITSVAKDSLNSVRPALELIKRGDYNTLVTNYPDVFISQEKMNELKRKYLNKQEKLYRSSIPNNLAEKENIISNIASWLIQAGFDSEKSISAAKQSINLLGENSNISILRKEAFNLVSTLEEETENEFNNKPKRTKKPNTKSELVLHVNEAKEKGKKTADLLKEYGYVKNPNEFV
jgi:hypothetical protein